MKKGRKNIAITALLSSTLVLSLTLPVKADNNPYYYNGNTPNYNTTAYYPTTYTNTGTPQTYSNTNYNYGGTYNQQQPVAYPNTYPTYGTNTGYNPYTPNQTYNNGQSYGVPSGNVQYSTYNMPTKVNPIPTGQKIPLYRNQSTVELNEMVNRIGDILVQKSNIKKKVKFKVDTQSVLNAHTDKNDTITVYKGLIEYCEDGDELAYVIGHEIGHAAAYHIPKATAVNTAVNVGEYVFREKVLSKIGNYWGYAAADMGTEVATEAVKNKYSRELENDADLLAIDYVVAAGYNPLAAISIMNKIGDNYADFWANHPSSDKRIVTMYNYIKQKYPKFLESGYDSYSYKQAINNYIK